MGYDEERQTCTDTAPSEPVCEPPPSIAAPLSPVATPDYPTCVDPQTQAVPFVGMYDHATPWADMPPAIDPGPQVNEEMQRYSDYSRNTGVDGQRGDEACGAQYRRPGSGEIEMAQADDPRNSDVSCYPPERQLPDGAEIISAGHSHASFNPPSGPDVAQRIDSPERIHMVQNLDGDTTALVRSAETEYSVADLPQKERNAIKVQMEREYNQAVAQCSQGQGGGENPACREQAGQDVATRYGIRTYRGTAGQPLTTNPG